MNTTLLKQINEELQQLNEATNPQRLNLDSVTNTLNDKDLSTKLGLSGLGLADMYKNPNSKDWDTLYQLAALNRLGQYSDASHPEALEVIGKQYVVKLENVHDGKLDGPTVSGYIKLLKPDSDLGNLTVGQLTKDRASVNIIGKLKDKLRKANHPNFVHDANSIATKDAMQLVQNKEDATVFNSADVSNITSAIKILRSTGGNEADSNRWYYGKDIKANKSVLEGSDKIANGSPVSADFIIALYSYIFNDGHKDVTNATDSDIIKAFQEHLRDKTTGVSFKSWVEEIRRSRNLSEQNPAPKTNLRDIIVGDEPISRKANFDTIIKDLPDVCENWKIDMVNVTNKFISKPENWLLGAYLGGLCNKLTDTEIWTLPQLASNIARNFNHLKKEYSTKFGDERTFVQAVLLHRNQNDLSESGTNADVNFIPVTAKEFGQCYIRSRGEIKKTLDEVFVEDSVESNVDSRTAKDTLYFLAFRDNQQLVRLALMKDPRDVNDRTYIINPKLESIDIPRQDEWNAFQFKVDDQIMVVHAMDESKATNTATNLMAQKIIGSFGTLLKKSETSGYLAMTKDQAYNLQQIKVMVDDADKDSLDDVKVVDISLGNGSSDTSNTKQNSNDGSEKLADDQIKQAIENWLINKKPTNLTDENEIKKLVQGQYDDASYLNMINAIIKEVKAEPDLYTYDANLKTFSSVDSNSKLQYLFDKLNDPNAEKKTVQTLPTDNTIGVTTTAQSKARPNVQKWTSEQVRQKLTELAGILDNNESKNDTGAVDTNTRDQIRKFNAKGDLTDIINWLNARMGRSKRKVNGEDIG